MNDPVLITDAMRARAAVLVGIACLVFGASPLPPSRRRPAVLARMAVCDQLLKEGWSENQAGTAIGIDHSSVNHYRARMRDVKALPGYDAERELLARFRDITKGGAEEAHPAEPLTRI